MTLPTTQALIIALMVALGTLITRVLPFALFGGRHRSHPYIAWLGSVLPYAAVGLLVVYCLKGVSLTAAPFGLPEAIALLSIGLLHWWKNNTLLSIGAGTVVYMFLIQSVFR